MKKSFKTVISIILIAVLFPSVITKAEEKEEYNAFRKCRVEDTAVNSGIYVYDAYDETDTAREFSYTLPENGAAVLIFFRAGCGNCYRFLNSLSEYDWIKNDNITLTATEITYADKTATKNYTDECLGDKAAYFDILYGARGKAVCDEYCFSMYNQWGKRSFGLPIVLIVGKVDDAPTVLYYSDAMVYPQDLTQCLSEFVCGVTYKNTAAAEETGQEQEEQEQQGQQQQQQEQKPEPVYTVREGDNTGYRGSEDVIIGLKGTYAAVDEEAKQAILTEINKIRKEACDNGYPHPDDRSKSLTPSDYVPMKWSGLIEQIAAMRAAEASVYLDHKRLSASESYVFSNGFNYFTWGEVIAWNWSDAEADGIIEGIYQFYEEKEDWLNNTAGAVTGHYTSMIDPANTHIGISGFNSDYAVFPFTVAAQFGRDPSLDETPAGLGGNVYQKVKVDRRFITSLSVNCPTDMKPEDTAKALFEADITNNLGLYESHGHGPVFGNISWKSSNDSVIKVDENGTVTAVGDGEATLTASIAEEGLSASVKITVKTPDTPDKPDIPDTQKEHDLVYYKAIRATHFGDGHTHYYKCTDCGKLFSDADGVCEIKAEDTYIPVIPHDLVWVYDEHVHRQICTGCPYETSYSSHEFDKDVCKFCGYEREKTVLAEDIDGDGEVNNKDVVVLFRYVSGNDRTDGDDGYDYDEDGEVNNKDVVALFRYVSNAK